MKIQNNNKQSCASLGAVKLTIIIFLYNLIFFVVVFSTISILFRVRLLFYVFTINFDFKSEILFCNNAKTYLNFVRMKPIRLLV